MQAKFSDFILGLILTAGSVDVKFNIIIPF